MTVPMSVFTPGLHKCAAVGCTTQTDKRRLMCEACWAKVPNNVKAWVFRSRRMLLYPGSGRETMRAGSYFSFAKQAAIEAVQEAKATEAQNTARTREDEADGDSEGENDSQGEGVI